MNGKATLWPRKQVSQGGGVRNSTERRLPETWQEQGAAPADRHARARDGETEAPSPREACSKATWLVSSRAGT